MKAHVLLYDNFCVFEIAMTLGWLSKFEVETVALEAREYPSDCGLKVRPDRVISNIDVLPDLLVITGGNPGKYLESLPAPVSSEPLMEYIRKMVSLERHVAAICGGPEFLARAGVLKGRRCTHGFEKGLPSCFEGSIVVDEPVVVDGRIITARGNAFLRFGLTIMDHMHLFDSQEERDNDIAWISKACEFP